MDFVDHFLELHSKFIIVTQVFYIFLAILRSFFCWLLLRLFFVFLDCICIILNLCFWFFNAKIFKRNLLELMSID